MESAAGTAAADGGTDPRAGPVGHTDLALDLQGRQLVVRALYDVADGGRAVPWQATLNDVAAQVARADGRRPGRTAVGSFRPGR